MAMLRLAAATTAVLCGCARAFYLPGVIPTTYYPGDNIEVKVNSVTSVETHIPFEYYHYPVCEPAKIEAAAENLGELLTGSRIYNSPYEIKMGQTESCKVLCRTTIDLPEAHLLLHSIRSQYSFNWIIDNLPVAASVNSQGSEYIFYEHGYFIGGYFVKENTDLASHKHTPDKAIVSYFVNNHVKIIIKTNKPLADDAGRRIVGVEVVPASIKHDIKGDLPEYLPSEACEFDAEQMGAEPMTIPSFFYNAKKANIEDPTHIADIIYTYDVEFRDSDVKWASRWDVYLSMGGRVDNDVHWFSIVNSVMIVFLLSGMVAIILLRTLRRDVLYYNRIPTEEEREEEKEESGWKLIHAHVFRPPDQFPMLLSVFVGTGVQLFCMVSRGCGPVDRLL
jgi:transmembrane 9 superfamily protein 2/4